MQELGIPKINQEILLEIMKEVGNPKIINASMK
jgi:hypothetical protein